MWSKLKLVESVWEEAKLQIGGHWVRQQKLGRCEVGPDRSGSRISSMKRKSGRGTLTCADWSFLLQYWDMQRLGI